MTKKTELGQWGEDKACEYLLNKGFKIIERNLRKGWGELDIVAIAPDKTLVFVEVKAMKAGFGRLKPEDQMTAAKIKKFKRAASLYAGKNQELINDDKGWQLDLITIVVNEAKPLTKIGKNFVIKHYENIF